MKTCSLCFKSVERLNYSVAGYGACSIERAEEMQDEVEAASGYYPTIERNK